LTTGVRFPEGKCEGTSPHNLVQARSGVHPTSYRKGPGVKREGREVDHSPVWSAVVKNTWNFIFITRCLIKHRIRIYSLVFGQAKGHIRWYRAIAINHLTKKFYAVTEVEIVWHQKNWDTTSASVMSTEDITIPTAIVRCYWYCTRFWNCLHMTVDKPAQLPVSEQRVEATGILSLKNEKYPIHRPSQFSQY